MRSSVAPSRISMDIFAEALDDCVEINVKVDAVTPTAPRRDFATRFVSAVTSNEEIIVDIDDSDHAASHTGSQPSQDVSSSHVYPDLKRSLPESISQAKKKRSALNTNSSVLKCVDAGDADNVACVFVQSGKCEVPVALWNQYNVVWKGADFKTSTWIVVGNYERWFMQLVDATTSKSVRTVAKNFIDKFRLEFNACIATARKSNHMNTPDMDRDDKEPTAPSQVRFSAGRFAPVVEVNIAGFKVSCLNNTSRMVLKMDPATTTFIKKWVAPHVRQLAHKQSDSPTCSITVASASTGQVAGFQLCASATPNIREKVYWNPKTHSWTLGLRKPKGPVTENFAVEPQLSAEKYEEEKTAAYRRAIETWNKLDGSSRFKIPSIVAHEDESQ